MSKRRYRASNCLRRSKCKRGYDCEEGYVIDNEDKYMLDKNTNCEDYIAMGVFHLVVEHKPQFEPEDLQSQVERMVEEGPSVFYLGELIE